MASASEDEAGSELCSGSYSPSADVSGSETSSDCSAPNARRFPFSSSSSRGLASSSSSSSQLPTPSLSSAAAATFYLSKPASDLPEIERFAKLLLGEDMSGSGKGICTALAISNAITNLSATVFGELWRLEPLAEPRKAMWTREMECLLSVADSIVELTPSVQELPDGGGQFEVMVPRPRSNLYMNLPALKKLDAMLLNRGADDKAFNYQEQDDELSNRGADDEPSTAAS